MELRRKGDGLLLCQDFEDWSGPLPDYLMPECGLKCHAPKVKKGCIVWRLRADFSSYGSTLSLGLERTPGYRKEVRHA